MVIRRSICDIGQYLHNSVDEREPEPSVQRRLSEHLSDSEQRGNRKSFLVELHLDHTVEELFHRGNCGWSVHLLLPHREDYSIVTLDILNELGPVAVH